MSIPKILEAEFILSASRPEHFPKGTLPEVAFWGRSNVGKSSLINTLLHRKSLVRTSSRPGCTQTINYFLINQKWHFVDLPGYGYAHVPVPVKEKWLRLIADLSGESITPPGRYSPLGLPPSAGAGRTGNNYPTGKLAAAGYSNFNQSR